MLTSSKDNMSALVSNGSKLKTPEGCKDIFMSIIDRTPGQEEAYCAVKN